MTAATTFILRPYTLILSHDRRKVLHVNVTNSPTSEWTAQQVVNRVVLYACSTAKGENTAQDMEAVGGDGGFTDRLRDLLCQAGAVDYQVDAHSTAGHTMKNPYVRRFQGM